MPFQAVPNVAQVRIEGRQDNQLTINDTYWEISGGGINVVNLTDLVDAVSGWAVASLAPLLSNQWSLTRVSGIDLTLINGAVAFNAATVIGGREQESAPNNVAACISFRTGARGRSFRGRNFLPGVPNSEIDLNTMSVLFMSGVLAAYALLIGAGTFIAGWQWGVVSRVALGLPRVPAIISPIVSVQFVGNSVRSMRSREIGHGA